MSATKSIIPAVAAAKATNSIPLEVAFFEAMGFNIWNVSDTKNPIDSKRKPLEKWSKRTVFTRELYNPQLNIGFLSGYQYRSGKYIIVLDFDLYDSESESGINPEVKQLHQDFVELDSKSNKNVSSCLFGNNASAIFFSFVSNISAKLSIFCTKFLFVNFKK